MDNDPSSLWHTDWYGTSRENHWFQFELTEGYTVDGLRYWPRQAGNTNGTITEYEIQVSNDGENFETVASGNWEGDRNWKLAQFDGQNVKYVRLVAVNALTDNQYVFASEIRITGVKTDEPLPHVHSFGEWTVTTPATCTEAGVETRTCECGESETREISALGHTAAEPVKENEKAATCTEDGSYDSVVYCDLCNEELSRETVTVPALGHDWKGTGCTRYDATRVNPFVDVPEDSFYIDSVLWAVEKGITTGATPTTFNPNGVCQRAAVVTFLWRAMEEPAPTETEHPFTDVDEKQFYYNAMLWAVENGITNGLTATTFGPTATCNCAQAVTFLYRTYNK